MIMQDLPSDIIPLDDESRKIQNIWDVLGITKNFEDSEELLRLKSFSKVRNTYTHLHIKNSV